MLPTGISCPWGVARVRMTPSRGASISIAALSVSISKMTAPFATRSPSFTCHFLIRPVVISMSTRGRMTSVAMAQALDLILDPAVADVIEQEDDHLDAETSD